MYLLFILSSFFELFSLVLLIEQFHFFDAASFIKASGGAFVAFLKYLFLMPSKWNLPLDSLMFSEFLSLL